MEHQVKILCLSTYPVDEPRHGGQHRLGSIIAAFRGHGHDVYLAGVLGSPSYKKTENFLNYPGHEALSRIVDDPSFMEDWAIGELFEKEKKYSSALFEEINFHPDLIFVEQPWLSGFAHLFNEKKCRNKAAICYGSQNIEHKLKFEIVKIYRGESQAVEARDKVLACELRAIRSAAQVFCVSQDDLDWTAHYASRPPVLAANGVIDRRVSMADIVAANEITQGKKFALYCASAHPPNIAGFFDMFGNGAGCFPPDARMVVAGGAGVFLADDERLKRTGSLQQQYVDAGEVSEHILRGLLATAHLIILPITSGGGTNLKSAEALWSGRHVVGTTLAMRGFERFSNSRGVAVADDPPAFCNAIRHAFLAPALSLGVEERANRSTVLWQNTLSSMVDIVGSMEPS